MADTEPRDPIALNLASIVHVLLTDPRGYRVDRLMGDLGIQPRTYRKYRDLLRNRFGPFRRRDGTSRVEEVVDGPHRYLRLVAVEETTVGERFAPRVAAVHLARELMAFLGETDVGVAMRDLVAELESRTADHAYVFREFLPNLDRLFYQVPYAPKDYSAQGETLRVVLEALVYRRRLELEYDSASRGLAVMPVEPLSLAAHRGGLYLIARHVSFEQPRTFAIDRIRGVKKSGERFLYPPAHVYHPRDYTEGCFGIFREPDGGSPIDVELVFVDKRWLKLDLTERRWHPTQRFEELSDGRLRMTFTVNTLVEVWPWIRSFGDDVEVVKPAPA
jgi:predicted DNA-binding transcriptional regulator YafY